MEIFYFFKKVNETYVFIKNYRVENAGMAKASV